MAHKVYIGYGVREDLAVQVARKTLLATSGIEAELLRIDRLREYGLYYRPSDRRGHTYDLISNSNQSTDFSLSRFLVPAIHQSEWALFVDADVVFIRDVAELFAEADPRYAVMVVKHVHVPASSEKMDGQVQTTYPRKNWSSVMLWNCAHAANARLTVHDVNTRTGLYLHRFAWLHDSEIGALSPAWNWLVGVQPEPENVGIAHYTLGGMWLDGWVENEHDKLWLDALKS